MRRSCKTELAWYPIVEWIVKLVESRVARGREVLVENPWPSLLWKLHCFEKMMEKRPCNKMSGEPLELCDLTNACMAW